MAGGSYHPPLKQYGGDGDMHGACGVNCSGGSTIGECCGMGVGSNLAVTIDDHGGESNPWHP
eukprot:5528802-Karenia_brevis.AAC.1